LRGDDGVGPWLAAWAEQRFEAEARVRVLTRQQWTPDIAGDIAESDAVIFIDCSVDSAPGEIRIRRVEPAQAGPGLATHHCGAPELLALALELYDSLPHEAQLFTIGADQVELTEALSKAVIAALPEACTELDKTVTRLLA
jgi:hydrogenase maturation protease